MTESEKLQLVGLATLVIEERKKLDRTEASICAFLKEHDVDETDAQNWAGELVYNEGDDPAVAVERILSVLDLKVKE